MVRYNIYNLESASMLQSELRAAVHAMKEVDPYVSQSSDVAKQSTRQQPEAALALSTPSVESFRKDSVQRSKEEKIETSTYSQPQTKPCCIFRQNNGRIRAQYRHLFPVKKKRWNRCQPASLRLHPQSGSSRILQSYRRAKSKEVQKEEDHVVHKHNWDRAKTAALELHQTIKRSGPHRKSERAATLQRGKPGHGEWRVLALLTDPRLAKMRNFENRNKLKGLPIPTKEAYGCPLTLLKIFWVKHKMDMESRLLLCNWERQLLDSGWDFAAEHRRDEARALAAVEKAREKV
ncbi:Hypothetical predicted protein [Lecanosticta acicola]|uniref:Uncharacterized protein n=1 Tax=Lecanosticta acicola TaxID=111012 RepID=A0AAI8Z9P3_9PEZI|nr:Hypothetical predicted protein [Lecanosticta acicola]